MEENKRLFFGFSIEAPWPEGFPSGRLIEENCRHLTVAFLGQVPYQKLISQLSLSPPLPFKVGRAGLFSDCLFLPSESSSRVLAWKVKWLTGPEKVEQYEKALTYWLKGLGYEMKLRNDFLPHVTLCRAPFNGKEWKKNFLPLPLYTSQLHLYESLGHLQYRSCWTTQLLPPFEELDHTADIAFRVRGENREEIYWHAALALSFKFLPFLNYCHLPNRIENMDDIVIYLNEAVAKADQQVGCPFKAISFHGSIHEEENNTLKWDMIVDV